MRTPASSRVPTVLARVGVALAALCVLPATAQDDRRVKASVGSIDRLQITTLTRSAVNAWVHTTLPKVADGYKQTFRGKVEIAGVPIPLKPSTVMVQKRPDRNEAVFVIDLPFKDVPQTVLTKLGVKALDLVLDGTLSGDGGSTSPAFAVGVLKYGTRELEAPAGSAQDFVKFEAARLTGVSLAETKGEVAVKIFNPFPFPIPIRSLTYSLTANGSQLCAGEKKGFRIHPTRENDVRLEATASNADLVAVAGSAIVQGGTLDGRLTGAIVFAVGKGDITLPVDLPGRIQVGGGR